MDERLATFLKWRVTVIVGNLVQQEVTAIVNAANSTPLGGGGVDGAIHMAGGPRILEECKEIRRKHYPGGLPTGEAVMTTGGDLPAQDLDAILGTLAGANHEVEVWQGCPPKSGPSADVLADDPGRRREGRGSARLVPK